MKYKSKFEQYVHIKKPEWEYEPKKSKCPYTVSHVYNPDFVDPDEPNVLYEAKGRFRTSAEAAKYIHIQEQNPDIEIIFIFMNPKNRMPNARRRRNGTFYTMEEWADRHGFRFIKV